MSRDEMRERLEVAVREAITTTAPFIDRAPAVAAQRIAELLASVGAGEREAELRWLRHLEYCVRCRKHPMCKEGKQLRAAAPPSHPAPEPAEWQCPDGTAHLFEVVLNDHCIETIKRLTADPTQNKAEALADARRVTMRDGSVGRREPWPGELIQTQCSKCGKPGVVGLGWESNEPPSREASEPSSEHAALLIEKRRLGAAGPDPLRKALDEPASREAERDACTGPGASWCPIHGDCSCHRWEDGVRDVQDDACPLHGPNSECDGAARHPEASPIEREQP